MNALHAEWTKLRTIASNRWLVLAAVAFTVIVSAVAAAAAPVTFSDDTTKLSLTGIEIGQLLVAALAVTAVTGEYSTGMIRVSLTAVPRRSTVLAAKAAVVTGLVLVAGTVAVLGSLLAGRLILPGSGFTDGATARAAVGSVLYLALIALMGLGIAAVVRDSAVAIGLVFGVLYLFAALAGLVGDPVWERRLQRVGPRTAGHAIQHTIDIDSLPIGPWAGLGVTAVWSGAALLAGGLVLRFRDA